MVEKMLHEMICYNAGDVRRINHALKVYGFAKTIGGCEGLDAQALIVLELSAILHDIGIHVCEEKYHSAAGKYQEIEGPPIAKALLSKHTADNAMIDRVLYLIAHHHTYRDIDGPDYQILIEADFIVNFDEDQIPKENIVKCREKLFKTESGIRILNAMLLH